MQTNRIPDSTSTIGSRASSNTGNLQKVRRLLDERRLQGLLGRLLSMETRNPARHVLIGEQESSSTQIRIRGLQPLASVSRHEPPTADER
jgi:hypothetical protein